MFGVRFMLSRSLKVVAAGWDARNETHSTSALFVRQRSRLARLPGWRA